MTRYVYFLSLLFLIFLSSACQKEQLSEFQPGDLINGEIKAKINGEEWKASSIIDTFHFEGNIYFDFIGLTYTEEGFLRHNFDISSIPLAKGLYEVDSCKKECGNVNLRGFFFLLGGDGDTLAATYHIDENKKNQLEVEQVDLSENRVKGNFSLNFILEDKPVSDFDFPDKLKIHKGSFDLLLP